MSKTRLKLALGLLSGRLKPEELDRSELEMFVYYWDDDQRATERYDGTLSRRVLDEAEDAILEAIYPTLED